MKWSNQDLAFILYNNRSVEGVVQHFFPKNVDPFKLMNLEKKLDWSKYFYENNQRFVEIESNRLNLDGDDVIIKPEDIDSLTEIVLQSHNELSGFELKYLLNRGITQDIINQYKIGGLSSIKDYNHLVILNATCHPVLKPVLEDGIEGGGIIIPLFENDKLINCAIRKLSDIGKLKYSLACPDIPVWGLDDINEGDEIWICEGLFDMMALRGDGKKAVSVSSAMWSGPQLYFLLEKNPGLINILCDKDQVGMKTGAILTRFFNVEGFKSKTWICKSGKDAAEVIFEKKIGMVDIEIISITKEMIGKQDDSFNFLKYLENRKF
jgi:hypothetical protein